MADAEAGAQLTVDLPSQTISRPNGESISFEVRARLPLVLLLLCFS